MNFKDKKVNIDLGVKCTLQCHGCARESWRIFSGGKPIPGQDMTLAQFDKLTNYFKKISFCGTYSDPIFNVNFLDILKMCKDKKIGPEISTAASHKPKNWWKKAFAANLDARWIFGIDGLPEESFLYRKNQDGEKLFNMMTLAKRMGMKRVDWQYIVFSYNENNIKEARELANSYGINFFIIYTNRGIYKKPIYKPKGKIGKPIPGHIVHDISLDYDN